VTTVIIATTLSRAGGQLDCGHVAEAGELIFKLDTGERGGTTRHGHGLGAWVCESCSEDPETS
jgi:hypothetical protein